MIKYKKWTIVKFWSAMVSRFYAKPTSKSNPSDHET